MQVLDLVGRIVHVAEFFLDRLHLLVEIVLALALLHLLLDAAADTLLDLHQVDLALDLAHDVFDTLARILDFENFLFFVELQ